MVIQDWDRVPISGDAVFWNSYVALCAGITWCNSWRMTVSIHQHSHMHMERHPYLTEIDLIFA